MKNQHELIALANFLISGKAERFDMTVWREASTSASCGFAGCAIGHLPLAYPNTGLEMRAFSAGGQRIPFYSTPNTEFFEIDAIENYYDIARDDAVDMFLSSSYSDYPDHEIPQEVVGRRILDFVTSKEAAATAAPCPDCNDTGVVPNSWGTGEASGGCDIHAYIEYKKYDRYYSFCGEVDLDRWYYLFGQMASGVRGIEGDFEPRGFPDDAGYQVVDAYTLFVAETESDCDGYTTAEVANRYVERGLSTWFNEHRVTHPDWHTPSWLTTDELKHVRTKLNEPHYPLDAVIAAMEQLPEARLVFWFDN